jgi:hypothetical protein
MYPDAKSVKTLNYHAHNTTLTSLGRQEKPGAVTPYPDGWPAAGTASQPPRLRRPRPADPCYPSSPSLGRLQPACGHDLLVERLASRRAA